MHDLLILAITIVKRRMTDHYLPKLLACLEALDERLLWDSAGHPNTIGGVTYHLLEHVKRNTERLEKPDVSFARGIESYFPDYRTSVAELMETSQHVFARFQAAISRVRPETVNLPALLHLMEHTGYHLGQIVDRTQRLTGKRFQFVGRGIHERALTALVEKDLAEAADRRGRTDEKPDGRTDSRFGNRKAAEALVNAYMASWLQQDTDLFASVLHEEAIVRECTGAVIAGKEELNRWFRQWHESGNRVTVWALRRIGFDETCGAAFAEWTFQCEYEGRTYTWDGSSIVRFRDGLIAEINEYEMKQEKFRPYS